MPDDLRTRIAAVLYERSVRRAGLDFKWATLTQDVVKQSWLDDADAVICELGLRREELPAKTVRTTLGEPWFCVPAGTRYVTDWTADD